MWKDILKRKTSSFEPKSKESSFRPKSKETSFRPKSKSVPVRLKRMGLKRKNDPELPPAPDLGPTEEMKRKEIVEELLEEQS